MPTMARIYLSHAPEDAAWCRAFVEALRWNGADVWHSEQAANDALAFDEARRQLNVRSIFVIVLSPAALMSQRVKQEAAIALQLLGSVPERSFVSVMAERCVVPRELRAHACVSGPNDAGLVPAEAAARVRDVVARRSSGRPSTPLPDDGETASQMYEQATLMHAANQLDQALAAYDRALGLDPLYVPAWYGKGELLRELGRSEEALAAYDLALGSDALLAPAWYGKAEALRALKRRHDALHAYERALGLDPHMVPAWIAKGDALAHLERFEEALEAYERAQALDPHQPGVWNRIGNTLQFLAEHEEVPAPRQHRRARARMQAGVTSASVARYEEALVAYDRALALDRRYINAWSNKIHVLEKLGRMGEARAARRRRDQASRGN